MPCMTFWRKPVSFAPRLSAVSANFSLARRIDARTSALVKQISVGDVQEGRHRRVRPRMRGTWGLS